MAKVKLNCNLLATYYKLMRTMTQKVSKASTVPIAKSSRTTCLHITRQVSGQKEPYINYVS